MAYVAEIEVIIGDAEAKRKWQKDRQLKGNS